jgi:DNA primase
VKMLRLRSATETLSILNTQYPIPKMKITQSTIDTVKDTIGYADFEKILRGKGRELKKQGSGWVCLSPFTDERSPSFTIYDGATRFKDFSSAKSGDVISLLMECENLEFVAAIERLAEWNGITVEREGKDADPEKIDRMEEMRLTLDKCMRLYAKKLHGLPEDHHAWQELLGKRALDQESIIKWDLGYAPNDWQWLWDQVREQGLYQPATDQGLIRESKGKAYDGVRDALTFPVYDAAGRSCGWGCRNFQTKTPDGGKVPKYINASGNDIYDKSRILYGMHLAKGAIRKMGFAYLTEGYMDVISMHRGGATNTVASCGTALTEWHVKLLQKHCRRVVILRDGDEPGQRAAMRDFEILLEHGMAVEVCQLPDGMDPDDYVRTVMPPNEVFEKELMNV